MDILVRLDEIVNVVCVCVINRIPRNHGPGDGVFDTKKLSPPSKVLK